MLTVALHVWAWHGEALRAGCLLFLYPGQVIVFNLTKKKIPGTGSCVSLLPKPPECWDCRCMLPRTTQIVLKRGERLSDCTCDQDDSGSRWRTDGRRCERTGGLHKARRGKGEGEEGVFDSHLKGWVGRGSLLIPPAVAGGRGEVRTTEHNWLFSESE